MLVTILNFLFSNSYEKHLELFCKICQNESLKLKFSKWSFAQDKTELLDYETEKGKIRLYNVNTEVIKQLKAPTNTERTPTHRKGPTNTEYL